MAFHPSLADSRNSQIFAANEMMSMKQALFPDDPPFFDYRSLIQRALDTLNTGLEDYASGLAEIRRTADLNGIDLNDFFVPSGPPNAAQPALGVQAVGDDVLLIDVDCTAEGVADVAGATRLLASILPSFERPAGLPDPPRYLRTVGRPFSPEVLSFAGNGNGLLMVGGGWGQPEKWGVWSVARRAAVTVDLEAGTRPPFSLRIVGRMFVHPQALAATGSVGINGLAVTDMKASVDRPAVELRIDVPKQAAASGRLNLEFVIDHPVSPASRE